MFVLFRVVVFGFLNVFFGIFWLHIGFYKVLGGRTPKTRKTLFFCMTAYRKRRKHDLELKMQNKSIKQKTINKKKN